ncbi:MAG TPA: hypothetical protein VER76_12645 [Pyrinomonadaceae bacterium]|nr:hypothetical protein [Pyrinomonadaceae bacterium]
MSEGVSARFPDDDARPAAAVPPAARPRAFQTIIYGGLIVGVLDFLDATIFNALRDVAPMRVWQFVASGVLGRNSFNGGMKTAVLGVVLHFLIAFILAAVYYGASLYLPTLLRRAVLWGLLYGIAIYFVMNYVVLPLSAAPPLRFSLASFLNGVIGHALLVGLPVALIARRSQT